MQGKSKGNLRPERSDGVLPLSQIERCKRFIPAKNYQPTHSVILRDMILSVSRISEQKQMPDFGFLLGLQNHRNVETKLQNRRA